MIGSIISAVAGPILSIIDKSVTDKDEAQRLKHAVQMELIANGHNIEKAAADIIRTEAASEHWITANWRPVLMLAITGILINNFLIAPYLEWWMGEAVVLPLPDALWDLLMIGVGGYVVGRSGEKIAKHIKKPD